MWHGVTCGVTTSNIFAMQWRDGSLEWGYITWCLTWPAADLQPRIICDNESCQPPWWTGLISSINGRPWDYVTTVSTAALKAFDDTWLYCSTNFKHINLNRFRDESNIFICDTCAPFLQHDVNSTWLSMITHNLSITRSCLKKKLCGPCCAF